MGQVVFVEEVSLVQVGTGRRPSPLSPICTHSYSVSPMGPGAATPRTSTSTTITFVQCGLSTSETKCSGFNYLSILKIRKKIQNFALGLCELRAFFMI